MTTAEHVAPLDPPLVAAPAEATADPAITAPVPVASRLIGAIAVGIALLSATFLLTVRNEFAKQKEFEAKNPRPRA